MKKHGRSVTRRTFLKTAAVAGAAVAFPTIVPCSVFGANAPSNRITLGMIGCGDRTNSLHPPFLQLTDCQIVAVCDPYKSRRDAKAQWVDSGYGTKGCRAMGDFRDLVARKDIDAVVIATQDSWHVPTALAAVRAGKDLYVEKPLGLSIHEDLVLLKAVTQYGRVFQYGTQQRSMDHCRRACELVRNGLIGKIKSVEVHSPGSSTGGSTAAAPVPEDLDYEMYLGPTPMVPFTKDRCTTAGSWYISNFALGFIAGWGAHPLDLMVWGLGDSPDAVPVEFEGTGKFPDSGLFDTATEWDIRGKFAGGASFRFLGGAIGDLTRFVGEKGTIDVSRGGMASDPKGLLDEKLPADGVRLVRSGNHGQSFLDAIKTRQHPVSPIHAAVYSDTVSHLADVAMRTGRKIKWDIAKQSIVDDEAAIRMMRRPMRAPWTL